MASHTASAIGTSDMLCVLRRPAVDCKVRVFQVRAFVVRTRYRILLTDEHGEYAADRSLPT